MSPPNVDNMFTLKVDNVPFDIGCVRRRKPLYLRYLSALSLYHAASRSDELREVFSKYVSLLSMRKMRDREGFLTCRGRCRRFGEIGDVYIPRARGTNESRGFAFVRFMQKRDAEDAIEGMEGKDFQGRDLRVQFAKQRRPDNPREFYSRSADDDRGGRGGYDDRGYDDRRGGYDDRRGDDRYGGGRDRERDRRDDYRRSRSPARHERSRRHSRSRSRSPRRDHRDHGRSSGRERSRSRHRSRSPPRRD